MDKEVLLKQISDNFNLSSDAAEAALLLLDTRAANLNLSLDEYIEAYHPLGFSQKDSGLTPEYKGYVQFLANDVKAIIKTGTTADFSTFVHEQAHIFRRQLAGDLKAKAEKAFKVENGKWTREQEEYFAIGFEEYIRLRMASSEDLRQVFERGARCMQHIYNGLDRIVELNPEIIKVYDEMFTESRFHFKQDEFEKTVKDINENSLEKFKASHVYIGMTPPIYQEIGFERLPVMITARHLKSVMQDWGSDANVNYHGLSPNIIAQIPEAIKNPLVIMQSQNKEHPEDIIAVVELKDKDNKPIIIPFSPNKKGRDINNFQIDINLAKTIYGKDKFSKFLENAFNENRILFINEKSRDIVPPPVQYPRNYKPQLSDKSRVLASPRVQFPSNQGSQLLYDNIARYRKIVKQKMPDFAKLYQAASSEKRSNTILFQKSSYYSRETQKEKRAEDVNKIAGYFIKAIETNTAPWMKPWKANEYVDDFNPVTKTTYKGINSVILPFIREFEFRSSDPRWYTFNNAKEQNLIVKKGEKATPIVFYGTVPIGKDGKELAVDEEGKPIGDVLRFRPMLRFYKVFHASQLGVPQFDKDGNLLRDKTGEVISKPIEAFEQSKVETIDFKPIAAAEKLLQQSGARIYHDQSEKSFYNTETDSIHLCPKEQYISESLYYGTALHELTHWTGSTQRLDRSLDTYGLDIESRAREELIAEIGSYALCKDLKLDFNPQNSTAYVQSWCEFLHDKPEEIMKATYAALEAKEYIQGFERTREKTNEREKVNTGIIPDNLQGENKMEQETTTNGKKSVREIGKEIWSLTNFSEGNIYGTDFETWYRECFPYYIHKATDKILNGDSSYKGGSFVEMEAWEAKDGKAHAFLFNKEHFVEYYDERQKKQAELQSAPLFSQEKTSSKKQIEIDFSGKEMPCHNPTNGKLYQTQEFEEHLRTINSDDKRYLSQNEIVKLGLSIKNDARPILLKTEKEVAGKTLFNYELLYNGKDIAGLPPVIGKEQEKASVRQPVRSIKAIRETEYGMEIG